MRVLSRRRDGFTLVEVLAAFSVLALVMTGLFVAVAGALRGDAQARSQAAAVRLAASHLAALGVASPIVFGTTYGRFETAFEWEQVAVPVEAHASGLVPAYWVTVTVRPVGTSPAAAPHTVTLTTIRFVGVRPQSARPQ